MARIARALISVTDKTGVKDLARRLHALGIELLSTGGTARLLRDSGIPVREVADVTEFPEMLEGRVKTIHPRIAGGVLAIRSNPHHMQSLVEHGIPPIDMVVVNLYEFGKYAGKPGVTREELIENIDIGGPTMIRAAAKNFQDVAVLVSPQQYEPVLNELESGGQLSAATHWSLAQQAFVHTAEYDSAVAKRLALIDASGQSGEESSAALPETLLIAAPRVASLRYGENPHQSAALYSFRHGGIAEAEQLHGKELSFNNLVDLDAAWQLIQEFERPAAAIIKHTNPCGCAEQPSLVDAYKKALEADPVSAYGGIIAFNQPVDRATASEVSQLFVEAIAAPGFAEDALEILRGKRNLRLVRIAQTARPEVVLKSISGGILAQSPDTTLIDGAGLVVKTTRQPSNTEMDALMFAWRVCKHVKSNAIVYAKRGQTISVGAGQMSRVDSVKIGAMRAVLPLDGTVVASDAFFPFSDGVEEAAKHGVTAIIQPGGSVRDGEVIEAANRLNLAMVFTGIRHFRH